MINRIIFDLRNPKNNFMEDLKMIKEMLLDVISNQVIIYKKT